MNVIDKIIDRLPPLDKKNSNLFLGGILLFIFLIYFLIFLRPQISTLITISPKVTELKKDLKNAKENIQKTGLYQNQIKSFEVNYDDLIQKVKTKEEVPILLENISRMANNHNIRIDQMMPLVEAQEILLEDKDGEYSSLPILVEARSGFHDFGRLLNEMEIENVPWSLQGFSMSSQDRNRNQHAVSLTLRTVIFEKKEE